MALVRIKVIPDQNDPKQVSVIPWVMSDRITFTVHRETALWDKTSLLGVWYLCLGDWDRTPEGTIAR